MKKFVLKPLIWRGFKAKTTNSDHNFGYAENALAGLLVVRKNEAWVTDITYVRIRSGFVYLARIMDLFTRDTVGYEVLDGLDVTLCLGVLQKAILEENPPFKSRSSSMRAKSTGKNWQPRE